MQQYDWASNDVVYDVVYGFSDLLLQFRRTFLNGFENKK